MAATENTEVRKSSLYDSKYLAEYYDLWAEKNSSILDMKDGSRIYTSILKQALPARSPEPSPEDPFVILDIGTGTGRVLVNISNDAERDGISLSNTELIGVDNAPAMLERAKRAQSQTPSMASVGNIVWALGEAATVASLPALKNYAGRVDLVIFAAGSISHLTGPDEPLHFFQQLALLLRPGSGRAYTPIVNTGITKRSITEEPKGEKRLVDLAAVQILPSKMFPNVIYKKGGVDESKEEGAIKTRYHNFHVLRQEGSEAEENVIAEYRVEFVVRLWQEPELLEWFNEAGESKNSEDLTPTDPSSVGEQMLLSHQTKELVIIMLEKDIIITPFMEVLDESEDLKEFIKNIKDDSSEIKVEWSLLKQAFLTQFEVEPVNHETQKVMVMKQAVALKQDKSELIEEYLRQAEEVASLVPPEEVNLGYILI
ncbi:hypothetical protein FQN51_004533 [Onygenales sp. PD_10]|nr:hypothetical protein FQN51_004533 [Onygenales sp. PD_10]